MPKLHAKQPKNALTSSNIRGGAAKGSPATRAMLVEQADILAQATERSRLLEAELKDRRALAEEARKRVEEREVLLEERKAEHEAATKQATKLDRDTTNLRRLLAGEILPENALASSLQTARDELATAKSMLARYTKELAEAEQRAEALGSEIESLRASSAKVVIQTATARNNLLALQNRPSPSAMPNAAELKMRLSHLEHVIVEKDKTLMTAREKENRLADKNVVINSANRASMAKEADKAAEVKSLNWQLEQRTKQTADVKAKITSTATQAKHELAPLSEGVRTHREAIDRLTKELAATRTAVAQSTKPAADLAVRNAADRSLADARAEALREIEGRVAAERRRVAAVEARPRPQAEAVDGPPPARRRRVEVMDRLRRLASGRGAPLAGVLDPAGMITALIHDGPASESLLCSGPLVLRLVDAFIDRADAYEARRAAVQPAVRVDPAAAAQNSASLREALAAEREFAAEMERRVAELDQERSGLEQAAQAAAALNVSNSCACNDALNAIDAADRGPTGIGARQVAMAETKVRQLMATAERLQSQLKAARDENVALLCGDIA